MFFSRSVLEVVFGNIMHFRSQVWDSWSLLPKVGGQTVFKARSYCHSLCYIHHLIFIICNGMSVEISMGSLLCYINFCTFYVLTSLFLYSLLIHFVCRINIPVPHPSSLSYIVIVYINVIQTMPWYAAYFIIFFVYGSKHGAHVIRSSFYFTSMDVTWE
jgi:hypothetical protein